MNIYNLISLAMISANLGGVVVLAQTEYPTEEFVNKIKEQAEREQRDLESAAVQFQKLAADCESRDNMEWLEPPAKKFKGSKSYLNGQNLPFYHRFS
jgi:hypothetical protein